MPRRRSSAALPATGNLLPNKFNQLRERHFQRLNHLAKEKRNISKG